MPRYSLYDSASNLWTFPHDQQTTEDVMIGMIAEYNTGMIAASLECHPLQPQTTWHRTVWQDEDISPSRCHEADAFGDGMITPTPTDDQFSGCLMKVHIDADILPYGRPWKEVSDDVKRVLTEGRCVYPASGDRCFSVDQGGVGQ